MQWRFGRLTLSLLAIAVGALLWAFRAGLQELVNRWNSQPEYGHGYLLPLVSGYLIWEQRSALQKIASEPSWAALGLILGALLLFVVGELGALFLLIQVAFIVALIGLCGTLLGWRGTRLIVVPLSFLFFAVPLPYFIEAQLTAKLQLWSSQLGVAFIRLWNIPVFLEGNLIDLGKFRMAVIDACSGLAYLYPLFGLGCICAYLFRAAWWKRVLLILSTIPIAIVLNSLRIGMTGLLVRHFGPSAADGFLHDFQGWAVFGVCVLVLVLEMWALNFLHSEGPRPGTAADPETVAETVRIRPLGYPFVFAVALIFAAVGLSASFGERVERQPERQAFVDFPMRLGDWNGEPQALEPGTVDFLGVTDYLLADYLYETAPINVYVAYYASQRTGASPHSPMVCLPGGGWLVSDTTLRELKLDEQQHRSVLVKRARISKGDVTDLMYYWYQERGRQMTDEYAMKWYLIRDALLLGRSDGALVRVRTTLLPGEREADMDARLTRFVAALLKELPRFLPD